MLREESVKLTGRLPSEIEKVDLTREFPGLANPAEEVVEFED